jgi:hypothetical protein
MKNKNAIYLLAIFAVVLFGIMIGIVFINVLSKPAEKEPVISLLPTPTPLINPGVPPVSYSSDATDRLIEKVRNRPTLSPADTSAKQRILSLLSEDQTSGYVYRSPTIRVEYLSSPDTFVVEILTTNISKAKTDAVSWFQSQGLSKEGICNLPISFYLNFDIANELRNQGITFSPLAEGC